MTIEIVVTDITALDVDAIVNAANTTLLGGGGVDGAIHRAAGPEMLKECAALGGCNTGQAKVTKGYGLMAKYVIHTVGPVWRGGKADEGRLLASCYRESLSCAYRLPVKSIAFPAISTGVYGFPANLAAHIAARAVNESLAEALRALSRVVFCCFSNESANFHREAWLTTNRALVH